MDIIKILNEMQYLVENSYRIPLTDKVLIKDDELTYYIDALKTKCPNEFIEAENIISTKKAIIQDGEAEADRIIQKANAKAIEMTKEHQIVIQANEEAKKIINEAREKYDEAIKKSEELKTKARKYALDILAIPEGSIKKSMEELIKLQEALAEAKSSLENYNMNNKK